MMHPKHFVELDPLSRHMKANAEFWQATVDEHNKAEWVKGIRGVPVSIMVQCGDDMQAAAEVITRVIRIWNLLRDVSDEDLGDVVVLKRSGVEEMGKSICETIEKIVSEVSEWEPGELADV